MADRGQTYYGKFMGEVLHRGLMIRSYKEWGEGLQLHFPVI